MSVRGPLGATPQTAGFELPTGTLDAPRASTGISRRGLLGIAGLLLSGFLVAISAAGTESLLPQSIQPVPASMAGAFAGAGLDLHAGGTIVALALMFVSYAVVVKASEQLSGRTVLMCIAALQALVLLAPPLISTDVFSYQAYARMGATYGANPYLNGPHAIALDTVFPYIGAKWSYIPSVYGPVFTTFSYLLAPLSIASSVIAYKALAAVASLGVVALVWNAARRRDTDPVRAVALVGCNPLLILFGVGGGHNDLLMLLALVAAIYAVLASRERLGGGLAVLAAGIKLTAGLVLPFAIVAEGRRRGRGRRRDLLIGAGAVLALVASLSFALYGTGVLHLFGTVQQSQSEGDWQSIPGLLATGLGLATVGHVVGYMLAAIFVAITGWLLRRVWRGEMDWIAGAGWATAALLVAASSLLPWYVCWLLPLAALARDPRLVRTTVVITGVVLGIQLLGYIPNGASMLGF